MSNQSSVYSEKKIAAYETLFKETNFAKPQEVYLTITVAHVFGQAYILEQEGTVEGDPVYSRFVCPLEEITKVYVNDKIKKPWPLFIQCDTNVKGVVHRKRIVVPCLDDPMAIANQINSIKAQHMEKYEAALEREKQRKREQLENARIKEKIESEAKKELPPLPTVEKLPDIPEFKPEDIAASAKAAEPAAEKKKPAKSTRSKKSSSSIEALSNALEDSFKAFDDIGTKSDIKPLPKKPKLDLDAIPDAAPIGKKSSKAAKAAVEEAVPEPEAAPIIEEAVSAVEEEAPVVEEAAPAVEMVEAVEEVQPAVEYSAEPEPEPVAEAVPEAEIIVEAVPEPAAEIAAEPEPIAEAAAEVAPEPVVEAVVQPVAEAVPETAPAPVAAVSISRAAELADFETAVLKLKTMKDNGLLSDEEFAEEKKKLIATLF